MAATDKFFAGSIPEIYERFLVPLIFESYALDLAKRVADTEPRDVLGTAAGTGVLTRAMASRLPAATRIVATDLNQPMLDQAQSGRKVNAKSNGGRPMPWRCRFRLKASMSSRANSGDVLSRQNQSLQGSAAGSAIWRSSDIQCMGPDFRKRICRCRHEALAEIFPHDPPRFMARIPHGYHDMEQIRRELPDGEHAAAQ